MTFLFSLVPLLCFLVFCTKVIGFVPSETFHYWLYSANWQEFTGNVKVSMANAPYFCGNACVQNCS